MTAAATNNKTFYLEEKQQTYFEYGAAGLCMPSERSTEYQGINLGYWNRKGVIVG